MIRKLRNKGSVSLKTREKLCDSHKLSIGGLIKLSVLGKYFFFFVFISLVETHVRYIKTLPILFIPNKYVASVN